MRSLLYLWDYDNSSHITVWYHNFEGITVDRCGRDRKDASGRKPTDPAYNPCTLHLPADFIKGLSGGQVCLSGLCLELTLQQSLLNVYSCHIFPFFLFSFIFILCVPP